MGWPLGHKLSDFFLKGAEVQIQVNSLLREGKGGIAGNHCKNEIVILTNKFVRRDPLFSMCQYNIFFVSITKKILCYKHKNNVV